MNIWLKVKNVCPSTLHYTTSEHRQRARLGAVNIAFQDHGKLRYAGFRVTCEYLPLHLLPICRGGGVWERGKACDLYGIPPGVNSHALFPVVGTGAFAVRKLTKWHSKIAGL